MKFVVHNVQYQEQVDQLFIYRENRQLEAMRSLSNELYSQAKRENIIEIKMVAQYCLAELALLEQKTVECFSLCWQLIDYYEISHKDIVYALTCNLLGTTYNCQGDMHNAVSFYFKGYHYAEILDSKELKYKILTNIGTAFFDVDCYEEALEYYLKCFKGIERNNFSNEIYEALLVNILVTYARMEDFKHAIEWEHKYKNVLDNPQNIMGKIGMLVYRIARDAYQNDADSLSKDMQQLIELSQKSWTGVFSTKLFMITMEACLKVQKYEYIEICLQILEEKVDQSDYKTRMHMSDLCVKMYEQKHDKDLYEKELEIYHDLHHKASKYDKLIEYKNLKNIILLEEERFMSKKLMSQHKELSKKSECDSFTGLLHKTAFIKKMNDYFMHKKEESVGIFIILDIDDFKNINDTHGHIFGDNAIIELSKILTSHIRSTDIIGRVGGDEFCFVLKNVKNLSRIHMKLQQILEDVRKIKLKNMDQGISISIGGVATKCNKTYQELLRIADKALYEAKEKGKNNYVLLEDN